MDEPKVREAKSSDQRALARASTRSGALVDLHRFRSGQVLILGGPLFEGHG